MIPTGEREPVERRCLYLEGTSLDDGFDALAVPAEFEAAAGNAALKVRFVEGFPYAQVYAAREGLRLLRADDGTGERVAQRRWSEDR